MLLSMTGYGRATQNYLEKTIRVELRSLNSKFTDLKFKIPQNYREKEAEMRKIVTDKLERGKIDMSIEVKSAEGDDEYGLNKALFTKYYKELKSLSEQLGIEVGDATTAILRIPNVVSTSIGSIDEEEWKTLFTTINLALEDFTRFRKTEGSAMEKDCRQRIASILSNLEQVTPFETERIQKLRTRLDQLMTDHIGKDKIDSNRFEQEILYYMEKLDITEEKVRLEQHCLYFLEVLNKPNTQKGRKLNFISQEMGREINTLGSKANSSNIQRLVVQMKDELEKIKEMVANTL